ncbi:MAG: purine-nucleoside phosphorylase [Desulfobacterales bacterium RIFOXYA12_FULL_46_15]|nr:MAG: purine-nucleoside phosphorylase [Desulfobacterales bacterium RIFOXYA12_FULL_46_15]
MNYPTWSDLNNESIVPPLGARRAPDIGPVALLVSCEPDIKLITAALDKPVTLPFFNSALIAPRDKGISVAGPFIGAPYAAMLLDSLIARGAKKVLVVGWCGAVTDELNVGDILLPSRAIVDEGTSRNYKHLDEALPVSVPDLKLLQQLSAYLSFSGISHKKQGIWTTDAIYRETKKKVAFFRNLGAKAVEMECSALFSVAEYHKISIAGLLIVSDSVASKVWNPGFRNKTFKQARKAACEAMMKFSEILYENE